MLADVVGLGGACRVNIGRGDTGKEVAFHLPDFASADLVVLAALRELRPQFDRCLVDPEFFAKVPGAPP